MAVEPSTPVQPGGLPKSESAPPTLEDVYRAHAGFVWRAVIRLGVDETFAQDVMHEVFLVARSKLARFDGRAALSSWLYGIARGLAANHRRSRGRERRRLELVPPRDAPPTPEEVARRGEAARLVDEVLDDLDPEKREVFVLSDIEGLRGPEIAEALGMPVKLVYSRLYAARQRFKDHCTARHRQDTA